MPPTKRYSAPTNTIKLTFDFDTLDRLKGEAAKRKVDATRCAYELVQEGLGVRLPPPVTAPAASEPDEATRNLQRGLDAIRNFNKPPQGRA